MSKTENLKKIWAAYFSIHNVSPRYKNENSSFHITSNEVIYEEFVVSHNNSLLITDLAIYYSDLRWSLSNICKYAIYQKDNTIFVCSDTGCLFKAQFSNTKISEELFTRLISMQKYWLPLATNGPIQQKSLWNYAKKEIALATSNAIQASKECLYILFFFYNNYTDYKVDAALLLMHYKATRGDLDFLIKYALKLSPYWSDESICDWCINTLKTTTLSNIKFTPENYANLSLSESFSKLINYISSIANNGNVQNIYKIHSYSKLLSTCSNDENTIKEWYKKEANHIKTIRESISTGSTSFSTSSLYTRDIYGLSAFSYAVLFNNKSIYKNYSPAEFAKDSFNEDSVELAALVDPLFISLYRNDLDTFNYLVTRSEEFLSLKRALEEVRKRINDEKNQIEFSNIQSESVKILSEINSFKKAERRKRYSSFKETEASIIEEIERIKAFYKEKYDTFINYFESSEDTFINMMLSSYRNPIIFLREAFIAPQLIVYFNNIPFLVDANYYAKFKNIHKKRSYSQYNTNTNYSSKNQHQQDNHTSSQKNYTEFKKEAKAAEIKKPYGNSWFSPSAHQDPDALKREYRKLIMKYHPDCPEGSSDIFIDIQDERASILKQMSR